MSTRKENKPVCVHTDAYSRDCGGPNNGAYDIDLTVHSSDGTPIEERGTANSITHPVTDHRELHRRAHITAQFAHQNRAWRRSQASERDKNDETATSHGLLDVVGRALRAEGMEVTDAPVDPKYVYAILLHDAYRLDSVPALYRYLNDHPSIADRLDLTDIESYSPFYDRLSKLERGEYRQAIRNAGERSLHAVWRNGYWIEPAILERWGIYSSQVVKEEAVDAATRREAIRNWVRLLFSESMSALTFDRADNIAYPFKAFIGAFAHSALQNIGVSNGAVTAGWVYDADAIPGGNGVLKRIKSLSVDEIESQFIAANEAVFRLCDDYGLFDDPHDLAFDTTGIDWWGKATDATVNRPRKSELGSEWVFAVLGSMNTDAQLAFGVRHVKSKDRHDELLDELLEIATTHVDVGCVYADREFYDGSVISVMRKHAGKWWVVHAKGYDEIEAFVRRTPSGKPDFKRNINATGATPRPNAFVAPKDFDRDRTLAHFMNPERGLDSDSFMNPDTDRESDGVLDTHKPYLSDLTPEDTTADKIHFRYQDRSSIETTIRQLKHDMHPVTESDDVRARLYGINIALLFYNWHTLINRVVSPQYQLPLTVTHQELLTAIRDVAFRRNASRTR